MKNDVAICLQRISAEPGKCRAGKFKFNKLCFLNITLIGLAIFYNLCQLLYFQVMSMIVNQIFNMVCLRESLIKHRQALLASLSFVTSSWYLIWLILILWLISQKYFQDQSLTFLKYFNLN